MAFLTFGEIMLRMTPLSDGARLGDVGPFSVGYAGSESNVASSLAFLGNPVDFVTKLPNNPLGDAALRSLQEYGIGTDKIKRGGDRLGTYFIELGHSIRPSMVVYDRKNSAISTIGKNEFKWEELLKNKSWLFVSGITPALSNPCADETIRLVSTARQMGVKVSFDLNFRRSLWDDVAKARKLFDRILEHTDLLFGNTGALFDVYDMTFMGKDKRAQTQQALEKAQNSFGIDSLAFTVREHTSASHNTLAAMFRLDGATHLSQTYEVDILDRFGTGDAFAAACLHALQKGWPPNKTIDFSAAAFALKHTIKGDQHTSTENEIISIMEGNTSGHVIR